MRTMRKDSAEVTFDRDAPFVSIQGAQPRWTIQSPDPCGGPFFLALLGEPIAVFQVENDDAIGSRAWRLADAVCSLLNAADRAGLRGIGNTLRVPVAADKLALFFRGGLVVDAPTGQAESEQEESDVE